MPAPCRPPRRPPRHPPEEQHDHLADAAIEREWQTDRRWVGIDRPYDAADVIRLRGSVRVEHSLARRGAEQLWHLLRSQAPVDMLGAMTGAQAVQMVKAGLRAVYVPGWQVAADGNLSEWVHRGLSLDAADSVPAMVHRINHALRRADQVEWSEAIVAGDHEPRRNWLVPVVADGGAGFGGPLNAYELTRSLLEAGAAGVHFEDHLAGEDQPGHLGGPVLVPTAQHVRTLAAARLAADVAGVPTVIIARTGALGAGLLTRDIDPRDEEFLTGERSAEGYHVVQGGLEAAVARGLAYAPHADLLWCEAAVPDLAEARAFAERIHERYPDKLLAYSCSPSVDWRQHLGPDTIARFQRELTAMGYAVQFVTLAGWHALNESAFRLARGYVNHGLSAYVDLQDREIALEPLGYTAMRHQREVGSGYCADVMSTLSRGISSRLALAGSTERDVLLD